MSAIRVSDKTHSALQTLARDVGAPITDVVDRAVELYRRQRILEQANAEYAALRADPAAWTEVKAERKVWDSTLADGLDERPALREVER